MGEAISRAGELVEASVLQLDGRNPLGEVLDGTDPVIVEIARIEVAGHEADHGLGRRQGRDGEVDIFAVSGKDNQPARERRGRADPAHGARRGDSAGFAASDLP